MALVSAAARSAAACVGDLAMKRKAELKRAVLYVRVSTKDKQHPANQTKPLRDWCKKFGWKIVREYVDRESGGSPDREQFQAMLAAAARWEFDLVVCWSLDRFSREGIAATFTHLKRLHSYEVGFISITEEYFRTVGPAAELLIAVTAWVAEYERRRRQERIKAGLDRARAEGKQIGRRRNGFHGNEINEMVGLHRAGRSLRYIAARFKSTKSTVGRRITEQLKRLARKSPEAQEFQRLVPSAKNVEYHPGKGKHAGS